MSSIDTSWCRSLFPCGWITAALVSFAVGHAARTDQRLQRLLLLTTAAACYSGALFLLPKYLSVPVFASILLRENQSVVQTFVVFVYVEILSFQSFIQRARSTSSALGVKSGIYLEPPVVFVLLCLLMFAFLDFLLVRYSPYDLLDNPSLPSFLHGCRQLPTLSLTQCTLRTTSFACVSKFPSCLDKSMVFICHCPCTPRRHVPENPLTVFTNSLPRITSFFVRFCVLHMSVLTCSLVALWEATWLPAAITFSSCLANPVSEEEMWQKTLLATRSVTGSFARYGPCAKWPPFSIVRCRHRCVPSPGIVDCEGRAVTSFPWFSSMSPFVFLHDPSRKRLKHHVVCTFHTGAQHPLTTQAMHHSSVCSNQENQSILTTTVAREKHGFASCKACVAAKVVFFE